MNKLCAWCKNAATLFDGWLAFPLCSLLRFLFTTMLNGPQAPRSALHSSPRSGGGRGHPCSTSPGIGALSFSPHPCISSFPLTSLLAYAAFFLLFSIQWQEQILILATRHKQTNMKLSFVSFFSFIFTRASHKCWYMQCNFIPSVLQHVHLISPRSPVICSSWLLV